MQRWMIGSLVIAGITCLLCLGLATNPAQLARSSVTGSERTSIVHLFEWTWSDVAQECETYLGPNGLKAVQISPPQEHVVVPDQGYPWWQRYQPVSYRLNSRSGNRVEFADMVNRCRRAGVEIYADAVINHMTAMGGIGSGGTAFTKYFYPGLYSTKDFHTCRHPIQDYNNAEEVTQCELVGLADLDTGSPYVQSRLIAYLRDLYRLGVSGFRIDAAKHIQARDLAQILDGLRAQVTPDPFIYQEVIDPGTEAIRKQDYYTNGNVIDFEYGRYLGEAFLGLNGRALADLKDLGASWGLAPSDLALVFVDNHDKQRGHGGGGTYLTYKDGQLYTLANVFMLAFPFGQPQIMSSYRFTDTDQGPPADANGKTRPVYQGDQPSHCFDVWVCEHRWTPITNMIQFRNVTAPQPTITDWWSNGHQQIAFGRGSLGFVIINRESYELTGTFQTQLPPGQYCNVIQGKLAADHRHCDADASLLTVDSQGRLRVTVGPMQAQAIHRESKLTPRARGWSQWF